MKLDRTHGFSREEALARLQALTEYWHTRYGVKSNWNGDHAIVSGRVKGVKFDGDFTVHEGRLTADVKTGFLAEKLGGRQYVEGKLADYLNPANSLDSLKARV